MNSQVQDALQVCQDPTNTEETALTGVWTLSKLVESDESNIGHVVELGGVTIVSDLGRTWGGDIAYLACKVLSVVALDADVMCKSVDKMLAGIPLLVDRLKEEQDDVWGLSIVAVSKIAGSPQALPTLLQSGAVERLLSICNVCDNRLLKYVSSTILKLAMHDAETRSQIIQEGVTPLVNLSRGNNDPLITYYSALTLLYICLDSQANCTAICSTGGVPTLVQLYSNAEDPELKKTVGTVLVQLLAEESCRSVGAEGGAVAPAVSTALSDQKAELVQNVLLVIHRLCIDGISQQRCAMRGGAADLLKHVLSQQHGPLFMQMALESVAAVCEDPEMFAAVLEASIVPNLMQSQRETETLATYKLRLQTLSTVLASSEPARDSILAQGASHGLLGACEHEDDDVAEQGCICVSLVLTESGHPVKLSDTRAANLLVAGAISKLTAASRRSGALHKVAEDALHLLGLASDVENEQHNA